MKLFYVFELFFLLSFNLLAMDAQESIADSHSSYTIQILKALETVHAVAPALWPFEVASVLAVAERRGRINADQQAEFLERLRMLPILIEHRPAAWLAQQILPLARRYRLSAYDAAYLELAIS